MVIFSRKILCACNELGGQTVRLFGETEDKKVTSITPLIFRQWEFRHITWYIN